MRALSTFSSNSWTISPPSTSEQHVSRRSFLVCCCCSSRNSKTMKSKTTKSKFFLDKIVDIIYIHFCILYILVGDFFNSEERQVSCFYAKLG